MSNYSLAIQSHVLRPFNNRTLTVEHAYGIVHDDDGANAFKLAFALDVNERMAGIAFRSYGHPLLVAAGSVLTEALRTATLNRAMTVTTDVLIRQLSMDESEEWCAEMVVRALRRAIGYWHRTRGQTPVVDGADEPRRGAFELPPPRLDDSSWVSPGQSLHAFLDERAALWHALMNYDLVVQVLRGSNLSPQPARLVYMLGSTVELLPFDERELLTRIGLHGETPRAVARARSVSEIEVLSKLWEMARQVQILWAGWEGR